MRVGVGAANAVLAIRASGSRKLLRCMMRVTVDAELGL